MKASLGGGEALPKLSPRLCWPKPQAFKCKMAQ